MALRIDHAQCARGSPLLRMYHLIAVPHSLLILALQRSSDLFAHTNQPTHTYTHAPSLGQLQCSVPLRPTTVLDGSSIAGCQGITSDAFETRPAIPGEAARANRRH